MVGIIGAAGYLIEGFALRDLYLVRMEIVFGFEVA